MFDKADLFSPLHVGLLPPPPSRKQPQSTKIAKITTYMTKDAALLLHV